MRPRLLALLLVLVAAGSAALHFLQPKGKGDFVYVALLAAHAACGTAAWLAARAGRFTRARRVLFLVFRMPEILFATTGILFLFSFIYATNANMDYVQRFMSSHGNLRLAPNSTAERLAACARYLPLLVLDACGYVMARLSRPHLTRRILPGGALHAWALPLAILSSALYAFAFPSFLRTSGLPVLGFACLVPLLLCLSEAPFGWGIFYGTLFGVLQTMLSNYWLGTFDLLTLQFVSVVTALQYIPFMAAALALFRRSRGAGFVVFPAAWTVFDWLRSLGFLGYPWGMLGASQYSSIPLIQIASITGVWGVTFLVTLCNSAVAWYLDGVLVRARRGPAAAVVVVTAFAAAIAWGIASAPATEGNAVPPSGTIRIALVQQNDDPRKDDYRVVFDTLRRLTDATLASRPDLIVWSETAFVPNISRWSAEDPTVYPYAALVRDFLAYQKSLGTWLLTGNDDYSLQMKDGLEERLEYNGAVFFSPAGTRADTYHKIHLVPFTEYFPYKKQLPVVYALLQSFDAYLWEPGDRRVVFAHPKAAFSSPICFEDVFPDDVRRFVMAGAGLVVNISNDYWSLTDAEAMQHAANSVFRAVENGVPFARASASGLTCLVTERGRIVARAPLFEESALVVDVPLPAAHRTLYTRWGDWFPPALATLLVLALAGGLAWPRRGGRRRAEQRR